MNRSVLVRLSVVGCLLVAAALVGGGAASAAEPSLVKAGGPAAIAGSYIVTYKDDVVADGAALASLTSGLAVAHGAAVTHTYTTALRVFAADMDPAQAKRLAAHPAVAAVMQDVSGSVQGTQTNPPSWGLDRVDQRDRPRNNRYVYSTTPSNVHAYIIDTGIRTTHQDFGGRAVWNANFAGDGIDTDCHGHGTHVAGTVGGAKYGVAKGVKPHAIKVGNCSGQTSVLKFLAGIDWVTAHSIKPAVANASLSFEIASISQLDALWDVLLDSAATGINYVFSAGNRNENPCDFFDTGTETWPADMGASPQMITVGATTSTDARAGFSNWGACVDLYAPGVDIRSASHTSNTASALASGTSQSAPHVAGAVALHRASHASASVQSVHDAAVVQLVARPGHRPANRVLRKRQSFMEPVAAHPVRLAGIRRHHAQSWPVPHCQQVDSLQPG